MVDNSYTTEDFNFFVPMQKAMPAKVAGDTRDRMIQGIASTDNIDLQGEIVKQTGLDLKYFLKSGYLNNDHKPGAENKVGEPVEARITKEGLFVKGFLYKNHKAADGYWELLNAQVADPQSKRRVGFSVQGKVKKRSGNVVEKAWIQDIAVTTAPINPNTWADLVKSLSAGHATVNQTDGSALGVESLLTDKRSKDSEKSLKNVTYPPALFSKPEVVQELQLKKGWSRSTAEVVASYLLSDNDSDGLCRSEAIEVVKSAQGWSDKSAEFVVDYLFNKKN